MTEHSDDPVKRFKRYKLDGLNPLDQECIRRLLKMFDVKLDEPENLQHGMVMIALEAAIDKCFPNLRPRKEQGVQTSPTKNNAASD